MLLEEFALSSMSSRYSVQLRAFVRPYDCISAFTGSCMSRTLTQRPSASRTTGPWCVRQTVNVRLAMPVSVRKGTVTRSSASGRSAPPWR